jgi:hypothetical protein
LSQKATRLLELTRRHDAFSFEVDVAALRSVESPPSYQIEVDTPPYEGIPSSYPMARIDAAK